MIGIGVAYKGEIHAVVSIAPGAGKSIVPALASILDTPIVSLSVASSNQKAIMLYQSLGFEAVDVVAKWYKIFEL